MDKQSTDDQIKRSLFCALVSDVTVENRALPCSALAKSIKDPNWFNRYSKANQAEAVILAAVQHKFALAFTGDIGGHGLKAVPSWRQELQVRPLPVRARHFALKPFEAPAPLVLPKAAYSFLRALPASLCRNLVRWAPPVVSIRAPGEPAHVLAHGLVGFIASHTIPNDQVWVRVLKTRPEPRYSIADLAVGAIEVFGPFVERHRELLVRSAPDVQMASLLSGQSRDWCARVRQPLLNSPGPVQ